MKINNVLILNWKSPGDKFWDNVQAKAFEPLIEAEITMTLSWEEYSKLLAQAKEPSPPSPDSNPSA